MYPNNDIEHISFIKYNSPIPNDEDLVGVVYHYGDETSYESGPLFTPNEFAAIVRAARTAEEDFGRNGSDN